ERLSAMLDDAGAPLVLSQRGFADTLVTKGARRALCVDEVHEPIHGSSSPYSRHVILPESLAYVLFTSGSTGRPKGAQVSRRALLNFILAMAREPGSLAGRTLLSVTTLTFDIAGLEIFLPLTTGGTVQLVGHDVARDPARLAVELRRSQAAVMQATPSTW